jgi:hypothetical protein
MESDGVRVTLQDGRLQVIVQNSAGNAAQIGEGLDVPLKEALEALVKEELEIKGPAVGERENEAGEAAARATDAEFSERSPIDLGLFVMVRIP